MATFSRIKIWVSNEVLTASDLNAEFDNIIVNMSPTGIEDASANVSAMQASTSPGGLGTESLATSLLGEIQRIRYVLKRFVNLDLTQQWYESATRSFADLNVDTADIEDDAVTTAKILDRNVTGIKIALATVELENLAASAIPPEYGILEQTFTVNDNFLVPDGITEIIADGCGGGGGGASGGASSGGAGTNTGGGGGGGAAPQQVVSISTTPGEIIAIAIGTGGAGGAGSAGDGNPGSDGNFTTISALSGTYRFAGGVGGKRGLDTGNGATPGARSDFYGGSYGGAGGIKGNAGANGFAGISSVGGTAGTSSGANSGGGGGGGGSCYGTGGAGGNGDGGGGNVGDFAGNNTGAGGGGGSGVGTSAASSPAGGGGGSGRVKITWVAAI